MIKWRAVLNNRQRGCPPCLPGWTPLCPAPSKTNIISQTPRIYFNFLIVHQLYLVLSLSSSNKLFEIHPCITAIQLRTVTLFCSQSLSRVWLFATPRTVAHQVPLSMGILQARFSRAWIAMPSSRGFSPSRDRTQVSCIAGGFFTLWVTREAQSTTQNRGFPGSPVVKTLHFRSFQ